jgi:hypothetical protein
MDKTEYPFLCFDTEDDSKECMAPGSGKTGFDKQVTQIAAITAEGKKYYSRGNVKDFKRWLLQQSETYFYSLNIKYDLGALFADELDTLDQTLVGGRVIKAVWTVAGREPKIFVDVFNIWPMSVEKLGKAFGLEKLKTADMAGDKEYVFRDTEIIRRAMLFAWQFVELLGLEKLPATLGGLAVAVWQHWAGTKTPNCPDATGDRAAMFGGRVELFKVCNDSNQIAYTDINSLYPAVMRGLFPGQLEPIKRPSKKLPKWGIVTATVKVAETDLAPLPLRRDDGMILYPYGRFKGSWTILELEAAVDYGAKVEKVHECYGTNESQQPYKDFVDRLYEARQRGKTDAENLFYKLLMNNLYGRLGTAGKIGRTVWQTPQNRNLGVPFGERVLVNYQMPLDEYVNWSHSAYVTAYGRLELLKHMRAVGAANMIYCDTDSTIFDCPGRQLPFETGAELGQMKLVGWERHCQTYAPKMYHIGKTWKAKGVPVRLAQEFIQKGAVEYDMPFNMREAITFYDRGNIRKLAVWRTIRKERRAKYDRKKLAGNQYHPCKVNSA